MSDVIHPFDITELQSLSGMELAVDNAWFS